MASSSQYGGHDLEFVGLLTMASSSQYGGHDLEFVGEVADRFNCQICSKVIREPHLAVCCGQHFCESCLDKWFQKHRKESCPHCRAEGDCFNHVINKGLRSEINQLKIKCSNRSKGCAWTGELGQLKTHLESDKGCGFVDVHCPNKCNSFCVRLLRKDLDNHMKSECFHRQDHCEHCGHKDTYANIAGGGRISIINTLSLINKPECHYDICPEFPLACPNKCGTNGIKRKEMEGHRRGCPMEPVECPFAEAGCKSELRRHQLEDHVSSNQQQHLLLVMGAYKEMKVKLEQTNAKLTTAVQLLRLGTEADKETVDFVIACPNYLMKRGDSVTVTMPRVSEYHRTGKTWQSSPFYHGKGYKLCLVVLAKEVKFSECACVSIKICPVDKLPLHVVPDQCSLPLGLHYMAPLKCNEYFHMCHLEELQKFQDISSAKECSFRLVNDCLTFNIKFLNSCYLTVSIVQQ